MPFYSQPFSGAATAKVATGETTASTTYVSLATTTDAVTVNISGLGMALVMISAFGSNSGADGQTFTGFGITGASTIAASDAESLNLRLTTATAAERATYATLVTGLTPGSTTFAMKYRVAAGTGTWSSRSISVIPI